MAFMANAAGQHIDMSMAGTREAAAISETEVAEAASGFRPALDFAVRVKVVVQNVHPQLLLSHEGIKRTMQSEVQKAVEQTVMPWMEEGVGAHRFRPWIASVSYSDDDDEREEDNPAYTYLFANIQLSSDQDGLHVKSFLQAEQPAIEQRIGEAIARVPDLEPHLAEGIAEVKLEVGDRVEETGERTWNPVAVSMAFKVKGLRFDVGGDNRTRCLEAEYEQGVHAAIHRVVGTSLQIHFEHAIDDESDTVVTTLVILLPDEKSAKSCSFDLLLARNRTEEHLVQELGGAALTCSPNATAYKLIAHPIHASASAPLVATDPDFDDGFGGKSINLDFRLSGMAPETQSMLEGVEIGDFTRHIEVFVQSHCPHRFAGVRLGLQTEDNASSATLQLRIATPDPKKMMPLFKCLHESIGIISTEMRSWLLAKYSTPERPLSLEVEIVDARMPGEPGVDTFQQQAIATKPVNLTVAFEISGLKPREVGQLFALSEKLHSLEGEVYDVVAAAMEMSMQTSRPEARIFSMTEGHDMTTEVIMQIAGSDEAATKLDELKGKEGLMTDAVGAWLAEFSRSIRAAGNASKAQDEDEDGAEDEAAQADGAEDGAEEADDDSEDGGALELQIVEKEQPIRVRIRKIGLTDVEAVWQVELVLIVSNVTWSEIESSELAMVTLDEAIRRGLHHELATVDEKFGRPAMFNKEEYLDNGGVLAKATWNVYGPEKANRLKVVLETREAQICNTVTGLIAYHMELDAEGSFGAGQPTVKFMGQPSIRMLLGSHWN